MATSDSVRAGGAYIEVFLKDTVGAGLNKIQAGFNRFSAVAGGIGDKLGSARANLSTFGSAIESLGTRLALLGTGAIAPVALLGKIFADTGSEIYFAAQRAQVSVETISAL